MKYVSISEALKELISDTVPDIRPHEVLDRYLAPNYSHNMNGKTFDRAAFTKMVEHTQSAIANGSVTVLDELRDGDSYAERHILHLEFKDGSISEREVAIFGTFAEDGRFQSLSEIESHLSPSPSAPAKA